MKITGEIIIGFTFAAIMGKVLIPVCAEIIKHNEISTSGNIIIITALLVGLPAIFSTYNLFKK